MLSNIYLSDKVLKTNSIRTLVLPLPYKEGIANLKKAWQGTAMRVYRGMQDVDGPKESVRSLSLGERIKHLAAGLLLLVPLINTLALLILRKKGVQQPPAYIPNGFVCRDWVPAPYAAPMLWAIDTREYRVEKDPLDVRRKIEKENKDAIEQQEELDKYTPEDFVKQFDELKKDLKPDPRLKGEIPNVVFETRLNQMQIKRETKVEFAKLDVMEAGVADAQGARDEMEDTYLASHLKLQIDGKPLEAKVSAVFDGHGGTGAADFAKENLLKHLKKRLEEFNSKGLDDVGVWNALKIALVDLSRSYTKPKAGATANVCLQIGRKVWMANLGDSRAILIKPDGAVVQLTEDQKPYLEKYKRGIEKRGHEVLWGGDFRDPPRLDGSLAVARAVGDHELKGGASARPKITQYVLPDNSEKEFYLLQACDGIWDVANAKHVGGFAYDMLKKGRPPQVVAADIVKAAFLAGSGDNMTVMLRKL